MVKISKSDKIFSKIKNVFSSNESKTTSNDNKNESDFFISSYDEASITNNENLEFKISQNNNDTSIENYNNISTQNANSDCWNLLDTSSNNYYTSGKRKVLFKVEKYKFTYPIPKTTTLYYYPNLPIIQSLELTTKTKHDNSQTTTIICNSQQVVVPIEFDYEEITFKPYVSYSIALYNQKPLGLFEQYDSSKENYDINNLDIYTLENDALFLTPFTMCFPNTNKNFLPSDFIVDILISNPLGETVSPVCEFDSYYLYEVEVEIDIRLSPILDLSSIDLSTLNVLNAKLDKPYDNTLFTQSELNSITSIDFTNLNTLDYNIFNYILNLESLNISNTNANLNTDSNFIHLNNLIKLKSLIAENNHFVDYSAFALLTNLTDNLISINLQNTSPLYKEFGVLSIPPGDITSLTIFINLISLNLYGNNLFSLPNSIENLFNLSNLNLSNNKLLSLPYQIGNLSNLTSFDLSYNNLSYLPVEIGNLFNLNNLDISFNNLTVLPSEFSNIINLNTLNLGENAIQDLSPLYNLNNLQSLNISGNPVDPSTIENLPIIVLDFSNSNLNNNSLYTLKISNTLQTLIISGNQISDLTPLAQYDVEIIAINQIIYYNVSQNELQETYILDLEDFLLDIDGDVPCIDYISNGGICGPIESCDCITITWTDINQISEAYFTFSNLTDTFTGKVSINFELDPIS